MGVTLKQVAERANVSRGTVDRVLHGRYGVDPQTRERVLAVMHELDYNPNVMARAPVSYTHLDVYKRQGEDIHESTVSPRRKSV